MNKTTVKSILKYVQNDETILKIINKSSKKINSCTILVPSVCLEMFFESDFEGIN